MLSLAGFEIAACHGMDVLKWIRQSGIPLVVVLLTASGNDADIATAYRSGANGFLVKPSESSKLDGMVKAIKDFWLTHNTFPAEASRERAVAPAQSRTLEPDEQNLPAINRRVAEEWRPMMSKHAYEKDRRISL